MKDQTVCRPDLEIERKRLFDGCMTLITGVAPLGPKTKKKLEDTSTLAV